MNILSCTSSEKPWVGVFRNKPLNLSSASLSDSSGHWWKEEMAVLPSTVFDLGKYFFKNFSTTSSYDFRLFPLKEWSHLLASPDKENENRLNLIASAGTPVTSWKFLPGIFENDVFWMIIYISIIQCICLYVLGRSRNSGGKICGLG